MPPLCNLFLSKCFTSAILDVLAIPPNVEMPLLFFQTHIGCLWYTVHCDSRFKVLGTGNKKDLNKIKLLIMFFSSAAAASSYVKIDASILL